MFKKYVLLLLGCCFAVSTFAENDINFGEIFVKKEGCFILYDLTENKIIERYNEKQCAKRISPCSTFKIPLALMAFDQGILKNENEIIKWDGISRGLADWDKDQTPKTWLQYSTVWVSQWLTPQLGAAKIESYLNDFQYGNKDMSGGITRFWLASTLKISADEQLNFLKRLWQNQLSVSDFAIRTTKNALYAEKTATGGTFYSKTGSGFDNEGNRLGWAIGYLSSNNHDYVFITNFTSKVTSKIAAGQEAKGITEQVIRDLGLW